MKVNLISRDRLDRDHALILAAELYRPRSTLFVLYCTTVPQIVPFDQWHSLVRPTHMCQTRLQHAWPTSIARSSIRTEGFPVVLGRAVARQQPNKLSSQLCPTRLTDALPMVAPRQAEWSTIFHVIKQHPYPRVVPTPCRRRRSDDHQI